MSRTAAIAVQVVVGLLVVFAVYRMSLWIMRKDQLLVDERQNRKPQESTKVVDGFIDTPLITNRSFDTRNPHAKSYVRMPRSFNRKGGAQFSYSFWMFIDDTLPTNVRNRVILTRGDSDSYKYSRTTNQTDAVLTLPPEVEVMNRPLVKCPSIAFGDTYDSFVVTFNTLDNPDESVSITPSRTAKDPTARHNVIKLIKHKWALLTFVFEDNVAINDFEDGIIVRFYINDIMYQVDKRNSTLRQNAGDLVLFPPPAAGGAQDSGLKGARIGDLTYHNFALSGTSVRDIYNGGPPRHFATDLAGHNMLGDPLHLSIYNKLDVYNT